MNPHAWKLSLCLIVAATAIGASGQPEPKAVARPTASKPDSAPSAHQLDRLRRALEPLHAQYDPVERMLREPFHSPGYHTTLKGGFVHPTRSSLTYAVALLDTGDEALLRRAEEILRRVIALQDQNPASKTYGIWSWFLEEPLDQMSPPDWNWADFCGVALLQVALDHRERLSPDVAKQVDEAIRHAALSIQRRNVGPGYTNIAIMGSYVTLVAAELYGWDDLKEYALARWRRFYDYTKEQGAFTEYNSPTYTVVALKELGRMRQHVKDSEARRMTEEMYRRAWEEIAFHWHAPTRQWAGPHSRCYSTLLRADVLSLIERATDGRVELGVNQPSLDEVRLSLSCPRDLEPFFTGLKELREFRETFQKGSNPQVGTTYLTPEFALGSINRGDFWNQRRGLVAYWGSGKKPGYLHLRVLRNSYDFSAAQFFSVQSGGDVLAAINFATDGGNTHVSLDRLKDGVFTAGDLRVRFELGGGGREADLTAIAAESGRSMLRFGKLGLFLTAPKVVFGDYQPRWDTGRDQDKVWLDLVLYSGESQRFRLADLGEAVIAVAVRMTTDNKPAPEVQSEISDGWLRLRWDKLGVEVPVVPARVGELQRNFVAAMEGR